MNSENPKISIVIPSYNQGEFLERTLLSIIDQNYDNTEIILIDGASDDSTLSVIEKYKKQIDYWVSEKDRGQAHALNKGFAKASGDIYGWQNSDDIYEPGAFEKVVEIFKKNPEKKIVYGNWYEIDENDRITDRTFSAPRPRVPHFSYEGFDAYNQTMFWRREVHEHFGKFDESLHMLMDGDMIFRFIFNEGVGAFYKTDDFLASFRRYEDQKSPETHLCETTVQNEKMLAEKFGFPKENSMAGKYYRVKHRFAKLCWHISQGGVRYTWRKFLKGYRKRGKIF
ncbi:MAG: glycosyltransferase family 2 protein [bacterium]